MVDPYDSWQLQHQYALTGKKIAPCDSWQLQHQYALTGTNGRPLPFVATSPL